jgi:hypothetical protein
MAELPNCMIGPSEPCESFMKLQAEIARLCAGAEVAAKKYDRVAAEMGEENRQLRAELAARERDYLAAPALRAELAAARQDAEKMREALNRYRYAHAFAGADSWDGGSDMCRRLEWAHASDEGRFLTANQIAEIGKTFPDHAALQGATPSPESPDLR